LAYSDDFAHSRVSSALEMVKGMDGKNAFGLPGRLLALSEIFEVEIICAGLIPPHYCSGAPDICYETDLVPPLPPPDTPARWNLPPDAETLYFTGDPASATPRFWTLDAVKARKCGIGKGLIYPGKGESAGVRGLGFFGKSLSTDHTTKTALAFFAHSMMDRMLRARAVRLTARQLETLRLAAEGKTDAEIAEILGISGHTVDKYMRQSKEALDAANRTAAIVRALRWGLIA
jgi:DNA-binding CsgD family transcriptional regulator